MSKYTDGQVVRDTMLPVGTRVETAGKRVFQITGYKSGVNYTAREVSTGRDGWLLRRSSSYIYRGFEAVTYDLSDLRVPFADMGAIVRLTGTGKFAGLVGTVATITSSGRLTVAIPGKPSVRTHPSLVEVVEPSALIEFLQQQTAMV